MINSLWMMTFGKFIVDRPRNLGQAWARRDRDGGGGRNADGKPISIAYLVDFEQDRHKPDEVLEQLAKAPNVDSDLESVSPRSCQRRLVPRP
jgi:hypothetical protein